jgi:hypothetical protein
MSSMRTKPNPGRWNLFLNDRDLERLRLFFKRSDSFGWWQQEALLFIWHEGGPKATSGLIRIRWWNKNLSFEFVQIDSLFSLLEKFYAEEWRAICPLAELEDLRELLPRLRQLARASGMKVGFPPNPPLPD